jgi:cytoskeletal protein CcmA (bactofilin family)
MAKMGFREPAAKMDVYISADSVVKGHLQTKSNIKVDGKINGNINAAGNVHVGSNALVEGNIAGIDVQIAGIVRGNINVSGDVHVFSSAKLIGDVKAASVEIEKGAQYKGMIAVGEPIDENVGKEQANGTQPAVNAKEQPVAAVEKEPVTSVKEPEKAAAENQAKNQPVLSVFKPSNKK